MKSTAYEQEGVSLDAADEVVDKVKPLVLIGSPPRVAFSRRNRAYAGRDSLVPHVG